MKMKSLRSVSFSIFPLLSALLVRLSMTIEV